MTVSSGAAKAGPYTGNDLVSSFAFGFKVFADSDIRVVETLISSEAETDLVLNTDYTVTRNVDQDTNPGGTVTYKVAGVTTALPSTKKLTIVGDFVYEQPTDIPNGGAFFANTIENALDRLTLLTKQIKERVDRSVAVGVSSSLDPDTLVADFLTAVADAETAAASAAASLDSFDDRYLGPKASDPSTDNDGAPLTAGVFYWNTTSGVMRAYNGSAWVDAVTVTPSNLTADTFSGTGAQTTFTLSATPPSVQSCFVFISGVRQRPTTDYTVAGTTLTFATPPTSGSSNISVLTVSALGIGTPGDDTVTSAKLDGALLAGINDFRLTLSSGVPVTTADVTGATTIYCCPYVGDRIALFDGARWVLRTSSQFSLALGTLTAALPYDVFCYDNSGTPTLEFTAWTNTTTRATALVYQNGVLVKSGATTRRYLGTFYTTATTTTEDSAAKRFLNNYYNQVPCLVQAPLETTNNWTYTTAAFRQANNNTANKFEFVVGVAENEVKATVIGSASNTTVGVSMVQGVALDSTSAIAANNIGGLAISNVVNQPVQLLSMYSGVPSVGYHYIAWVEYSAATGTTTFNGDANNPTLFQAGLKGSMYK